MFRLLIIVFLVSAALSSARAAQTSSGPVYESDVRPLFQKKCGKCHGKTARKANLDLLTLQGIRAGGETGGLVSPGSLDDSLLWDYLSNGLMPPEGEGTPLTEKELKLVETWIRSGARTESGPFVAEARINQDDVLPILLVRCAVCHGLRKQEAGLDLHTIEALKKGGQSGAVAVPGKPEESLLLERIHAGEMPPPKELVRFGVRPVEPSEVETLTKWIRQGMPVVESAPDVATTEPDPLVSDEDRQFWSFQPPRRPAIPAVSHRGRVRNPVDAFVLRRLERAGMSFSPEADTRTLVRRVAFDLTGLPPTWDEVERFLGDNRPGAYERMVDYYLASPQYGERWGRYWLDLAGYADSEGKRSADPIREHAWRYRDYVVRAFNADKPYDRFLLEQIAGDELADYRRSETLTPELRDNLVATGFLRMAPDGTGSDIVNTVVERLEVINDEMEIFSSSILGLTMRCAQCHSHKYDPIPQRDFYRLTAVFKGAYDEHDWLKPTSVKNQSKNNLPARFLELTTADEREQWLAEKRRIETEIAAWDGRVEALQASTAQAYVAAELKKLPDDVRSSLEALIAADESDWSDDQRALAKKYAKQLDPDRKTLTKFSKDFAALVKERDREVKKLEAVIPPEPSIRALWDRGEPSPSYLYRRGEAHNPGELVGPGVPSVLTDGRTPFVAEPPYPGAKSTGRRLALARWLVEPDHPLTARVMVNRIWQHHFGQGIVKSVGNFGKTGTPPTHPELLDWLAREFADGGWSIKRMHRLLLTSSTYRQTSALTDEIEQSDPANDLLSRMPMRRLEAEPLRDSLIYVAGRLDQRKFGRPDDVDVRADGLVMSKESSAGWRRSVYVRHRRKEMPTILETFDQPQMIPNCLERPNSTVASQALLLLNNGMVHDLSRAFAERVRNEAGDDVYRQIERAFQIALSRLPEDDERELARDTLRQLTAAWAKLQAAESDEPAEKPEQLALIAYCHALLNSAEFLFID